MIDNAGDFLGRVTFVTGPEKHCGKTTLMNRAAQLARRGAREAGLAGPALLTVGYDGEARDFLSGARKPAVPVAAGDVVVTTERFARPCSPEILDVLPGSCALGRLCVARARRAATVALVGPEGNSLVAWAVRRIVDEGLTGTVLVDGAINRITQAASIPGARFVYALRADGAGLERAVARVRRMATLARLPVADPPLDCAGGSGAGLGGDAGQYALEGALTAETAARLPRWASSVIVEDFTKVFLSDQELSAFMRGRELLVARRIEFGGFVVACRGVSDAEFASRLADDSIAALVSYNPYEVAEGRAA
ncbi:MAG: hypothetical protein KKA67_01255 [Spirochaetes bacterium]|nr:hypothetical protein [Spirochaetota bacterium]MBU1079170.1 hypothetical protein [Spirochaetota bacterium]